MSAISVPIEFLAQFGKALSGLDDFTKSAGSKIDSIEKKFSGLSTVLGVVGGAFAVSKVIDGLQAITQEAGLAEAANNKMAMSLRAAGDYSEQNVRAFKDLAEELARTSRFDNDLIVGQVALAKQFNTTNKEAAKLIRAAVDLAAVTGDDLPSAVQQLGGTLDGTVGRVGKLIPSLQNLTAEQLRNGAAIDIVAKKYAGFAQNELRGYNGEVLQTSKSSDDLIKSLGEVFTKNEAVLIVIREVRKVFDDLQDIVKANTEEFGTFVRDGIIVTLESMGVLLQATDQVVRIFSIMVEQIKFVSRGLGAFGKFVDGDIRDSLKAGRLAIDQYGKGMEQIGKNSETIDEITSRIAGITVELEKAGTANQFVLRTTQETAKGFDNQTAAAKRFDLSMKTGFESLAKSLEDVGATQLKTIENTYTKNIKLIEFAKDRGFINDVKRTELLGKLRIKYEEEAIKIRKESYDKLVSQVQQLSQNPFSKVVGDKEVPPEGGSLGISRDSSLGVARGLGAVQSILGGAEGARKMLGQVGSAVGTAFLGPAGQALGPIVEELSKGPDHVKAMVSQFLDALPVLIENLVRSIPVLIETLADKLPEIIERLAEKAPEIIEALIKALPKVIEKLALIGPRIGFILTVAMFRAVGKLLEGAGQFVGRILQGALQFVGRIIQGAGQFLKKLLDGITGGLFKGGGGGFGLGGDKGLLGGGIVRGFLKGGASNGDDQIVSTSAGRKSSGTPQTINVAVQISRKEIASTILDIKKLGYRLEPI
jgi:hypothetical protein